MILPTGLARLRQSTISRPAVSAQFSEARIASDSDDPADIAAAREIALAHLRHQTMLKTIMYGLAAFFVVVAALLAAFAPSGRETTVNIIALSLLVLSAGVAGFAHLKTKLGGFVDFSASAADPARQPPEERS